MERAQADAIAKAIAEPDVCAQEELQRKRAAKSSQIARKRRVAWLSLVGAGVGAAIAYYAGFSFSLGAIYGGLSGSAIGWAFTQRAAV